MAITIVDNVTDLAVQAAINGPNGSRESGVISACVSAFNSSNVTIKVYDASNTLLHTQVRGPWTANLDSDPKTMAIGTLVSRTNHASGVPFFAHIVNNNNDVIFEMTAGLTESDLDFVSAIEVNVPVGLTSLIFHAQQGLDTEVNNPTGDFSLFITEETLLTLVSKAQANHADWVSLKNWCNSNINTEWITSNWAGTAEAIAIGNFCLAYFIGSRIGDPNAISWGDRALYLWNKDPYYAPTNNSHAFFGPKHRIAGTRTHLISNAVGTFPKGSLIKGRLSNATAEIVCVSPSPGTTAAFKNINGSFLVNEICEVIGDPSSNFTFVATNKLVSFADDGYGSRYFGYLYSSLYFWLAGHPSFTPTVKEEVENVVKSIWDEFEGISGQKPFQPIVGIGNYQFGHMTMELLFGLILKDRYPNIYTEALRRFKARTDSLRDITKSSGFLPEGHTYSPGMYKELGYCLLALKSMTTESVSNYDSFTRNCPLSLYMSMANSVTPVPFVLDDGFVVSTTLTYNSTAFFTVFQLLYGAGSLQSKYVAAILARRAPNFYGGNSPGNYWHKFLTYNSSETFDLNSFPKSIGTMPLMAKADFNNNSTTVWVSAGPYYNNQAYQKTDQGSLRIVRTKPLLTVCEYNVTNTWTAGWPSLVHQNYCSVHGRTTTTTIQQYQYNVGLSTSNVRPEVPLVYRKPNSEYGPSHYEDNGTSVFFRVPYRTSFYRDEFQTIGPDLDRIARSVLYVRPNVVFVLDAFKQSEDQPNSFIKSNWHFPLEGGAPITSNSNKNIIYTNSNNKLWGHLAYPSNPSENTVELFDAYVRCVDSYRWQVAPETTSRDQFFFHVFRAGDTTGFSDPVFTDITATNVYGCLVSGLETSEGTQVCGIIVDNGTDTPPTTVSYSVAQTGSCTHYVAGLKKNTSYTVSSSLVAGTATVTITEGSGVSTLSGGYLQFEVS